MRAGTATLLVIISIGVQGARRGMPPGSRYLLSVTAVEHRPPGQQAAIKLTVREIASGAERAFDVPAESGREVQAYMLPCDRRAIVTERLKFAVAATVIDVQTGRLLDKISGYDFALSADRSRAVYTYRYPPHSASDDVVLLYDLMLSSLENDSGPRTQPFARGTIVYPPANRASRRYESVSDPLFFVKSPFAWCGNEKLAFVEKLGGRSELIVMNVPKRLADTKVTARIPIDRTLFLQPHYEGRMPSEPESYRTATPVAEGLSFSEDCRTLRIVSVTIGPFDRKAIDLPIEIPPEL